MAHSDEQIRRLAVLTAGRNPAWSELTFLGDGLTADPPSSVAAAFDCRIANDRSATGLRANYEVRLRENPNFRTVRVSFPIFDAATTYETTVNGNLYSDSDTTKALVIAGLASAISAGEADVTAVVDPNDSEKLLITGDIYADFTIVLGTTGGTGTISMVADATTVTFQFWALAKGRTLFSWLSEHEDSFSDNVVTGPLLLAGIDYVGVRIVTLAASEQVVIAVGVGQLEETT